MEHGERKVRKHCFSKKNTFPLSTQKEEKYCFTETTADVVSITGSALLLCVSALCEKLVKAWKFRSKNKFWGYKRWVHVLPNCQFHSKAVLC
ncbi:hypothetical protein CEXT_548111 [Caerostris extrusa]|uniref:Uncharacterized protein n=1 Tax=Caerostris extrusa TaxID=172846 RepID=A0AAV4YDB2_CAEEX|nr:hypothetical protein CEXT_548111 [Caerostris extrusa]